MRSSGPRRRFTLLSRRGPTAALLIAPVAMAGWLHGADATSSGAKRKAPEVRTARPAAVPESPRPAGSASVVQIVAHPDDDLFFMNPDTRQSIDSGSRLTSVYLTAGESDGVNAARTGPLAPSVRPAADKARYAEARQNGIRAAYAEMATGDRRSPWRRTAIPTAGGGTAELDVLAARPEISLVWVQLREAGSVSGDRPVSLHGLWDGRVAELPAQLASGSPVKREFAYDKEQVVDTVAGLLKRFAPTHVRMQDPTPGLVAGTDRPTDHQDHLFGARFAQAALVRYAQMPDHPAFSVQNYLGYFTSGLPRTLDPDTAAAKLHTMHTYAWTDEANYCGAEAGCGDRKVAARPGGHGWTQSVRYTRGESTSWVQPGRDGELWAFSVLDTRLAVWHRGARGEWTGHYSLSSLSQRLDGSWTTWRERGGQNLHGDPAVASDASGRQHVFVGSPLTVWSWTQSEPGAPLSGPTATGLPPTTLTLSAAPEGDGVRLWFRKPASGAVRTAHVSGPLVSPVTELGGVAGFGPVSASGPDHALLAVRSGTGVPGTYLPAPGGTGTAGRAAGTPRWHAGGPLFVGAPAGAEAGVGALGQDGRLYWSRPEAPQKWQPVD
ncbi:PIG-L family deacetylase [Streptomyces sp. NPDC015127]|uniref:PIG-L family deacetylase n=1 Tax=Streptomyces sp. NPDC015127 TaxID=3364939 RepID=UPI0036FE59E3